MEMMAGVFGYLGETSELMLRVTLLDLASDNSVVQTQVLETIDDDDYAPMLPSIQCFENFLSEPLATRVEELGAQWDKGVFRGHCVGFSVDEENDACRIAPLRIEVVRNERS